MKQLALLSANDFKMVFRDPMLKGLLVVPLLSLAIIVWLVPYIASLYPIVNQYNHTILMWGCLQTAVMFGFINGFIFLEEKDENVIDVLRVVPVSALGVIGFRLLLGVLISTIISTCMIVFGKLVIMPLGVALLVALQYSLLAPILTMLLAVLAKNKVEGLAHFKVYNLLVLAPILVYFIDVPWLHALALLPTYWAFKGIDTFWQAGGYTPAFWQPFLIGMAVFAGALALLIRLMEKKLFKV